jgi:hypothetical protein
MITRPPTLLPEGGNRSSLRYIAFCADVHQKLSDHNEDLKFQLDSHPARVSDARCRDIVRNFKVKFDRILVIFSITISDALIQHFLLFRAPLESHLRAGDRWRYFFTESSLINLVLVVVMSLRYWALYILADFRKNFISCIDTGKVQDFFRSWFTWCARVDNYALTYFIYLLKEPSPSWEAANCAATQELPSILWNPKVHHRVHKSPPLVPILGQIEPVHTIPLYLSKIYFNVVHPPTSLSS